MAEKSKGDEKGLFDSEFYFDLRDAAREVSNAFDTKGKVVSGAKLAGKTLFNIGVFSVKLSGKVLEKLPEAVEHAKEIQAKKQK